MITKTKKKSLRRYDIIVSDHSITIIKTNELYNNKEQNTIEYINQIDFTSIYSAFLIDVYPNEVAKGIILRLLNERIRGKTGKRIFKIIKFINNDSSTDS